VKKRIKLLTTVSNNMLIGLISDVHSNAVALKAVLEELDELGVKTILHAGSRAAKGWKP
jgi:predicted phosphodiesterase